MVGLCDVIRNYIFTYNNYIGCIKSGVATTADTALYKRGRKVNWRKSQGNVGRMRLNLQLISGVVNFWLNLSAIG